MRAVRPASLEPRPSQEALLDYRDSIQMEDSTSAKAPVEETQEDIAFSTSITDETSASRGAASVDARGEAVQSESLRLYKRRFFGLFQLVLLNVIVSWDVSYLLL